MLVPLPSNLEARKRLHWQLGVRRFDPMSVLDWPGRTSMAGRAAHGRFGHCNMDVQRVGRARTIS